MLQGEDGQTAVLTWKICKSLRKEVPPDVFCTVSNLFGTAMKLDKYGKSRFEFLCAKIPDPGCERITFSASMSQSKSERFKDTQKRHSKKLGGSMPTLYKSAVHPTSAWREKPPSQACPSVP